MSTNQTLQILHQLKLNGMADAFEQQIQQPETHNLSFEERFSFLVDREALARENRRLARFLKLAKFRHQASVEDIDYRQHRGLQKSQVTSLASCDWIRNSQNLCLTGPTGTGKTYLACALGNQACRQGFSVRYVRLPRFHEVLRIAHGDGSYVRLMNQLAKIDVLLLDDWGLHKPAVQERNDLLEILEDRCGKRATLVTSQLPIKNWHDYLGDATIADAILDRLVHNSHKIQLSGESMRKKNSSVDL